MIVWSFSSETYSSLILFFFCLNSFINYVLFSLIWFYFTKTRLWWLLLGFSIFIKCKLSFIYTIETKNIIRRIILRKTHPIRFLSGFSMSFMCNVFNNINKVPNKDKLRKLPCCWIFYTRKPVVYPKK